MARIIRPHRQAYLFQWGSLRFGVHGLGGIVSTVLTVAAYYHPRLSSLVWLSQAALVLLVTHASTLLPQVPAKTAIIPGFIVAPHKEAFQRTIGMMQYLVTRIVCSMLLRLSTMWTLLAVSIPYFGTLVPTRQTFARRNLDNGNTWIFVLPIWLGTTADMIVILFWRHLISLSQLLHVQLVGLGLAFGFTLAFRNFIPMPVVYAIAAWQVWEILREGYHTIREG
jgi:hypothetical protein